MHCPACQHRNPDAAKYRGSGGGSLSRTIACSACQADNPRSNRFCHDRGANLIDPSVLATEHDYPRSPQ